jgi:urea transport system permease protein
LRDPVSLGHFAFFGLGGYMIGMWLMTSPDRGGDRANLAGSPIPPTEARSARPRRCRSSRSWGAEDWPWMWAFSDSLIAAAFCFVVLVPGLLALVFGWLAFRSRVTGVYLSILTQAMTLALSLYLFQNDTGLRGNNGLSGLQNIPGLRRSGRNRWSRSGSSGPRRLRWGWAISGCLAGVGQVRQHRAGIRDDEARVRFLGYPVEVYKLVVFTLTAVICGNGRARSTIRRRASSIPTRSRPSPRSTSRSGSPSAGAGGFMAR